MRIADRPFAIALVCAGALALSPSRYVGGLLADSGGVVSAVLNPPAHLLHLLRDWLRPRHTARADADPLVVELRRERDVYRGQWHAALDEVDTLKKKLDQLGAVRRADPSGTWRLVDAGVGVSSLVMGTPVLEVLAGTVDGVAPGDVAMVDGDAIAGRIGANPGGRSSVLVPVGHPALGRIDATITTKEGDAQARVPVQLSALGGRMVCDVSRGSGVAIGMTVRLRDSTWPRGAQGMVLGTVVSLGPKPNQPLRDQAVVDPHAVGRSLAEVAIKASGRPAP